MGVATSKEYQPASPKDDDSHLLFGSMVRERTHRFEEIYKVVGTLGQGAKSAVFKVQKRCAAVGGSSRQSFVKRKKQQRLPWSALQQRTAETECTPTPDIYYAMKDIYPDSSAVQSFETEIEILRTLDHPHIIRVSA
jgi:serine/threonine protein kinase